MAEKTNSTFYISFMALDSTEDLVLTIPDLKSTISISDANSAVQQIVNSKVLLQEEGKEIIGINEAVIVKQDPVVTEF